MTTRPQKHFWKEKTFWTDGYFQRKFAEAIAIRYFYMQCWRS